MRVLPFAAALGLITIQAHAIEVLGSWIDQEKPVALTKLLANINPQGTVRGIVIASPQRDNPNYFFHWTRDAALSMDVVVSEFENASTAADRTHLEQLIRDYIGLSLAQQVSSARSGMGEPKFEVDGSPFMGDWGRPQNDGPALRAVTVMHYARALRASGKIIDATLYDGRLPSDSIIKRDLEYVSHHWQDPSFDLWEETLGDHFYTRMVQRRALVEGAEFARSMNDTGAADWYAKQALELGRQIEKHFDPASGMIRPTLNRIGGLDYKNSDIDSAVILGVLHGHTSDGFFSYSEPRVTNYLNKVIAAFAGIYSINSRSDLGTAIGRYPEDRYAGSDFNGGNPWVLATLAVAQLYYKQGRADLAEPFIRRVQAHANPDGSLSEQIQRTSGFMTSARDLTWNYAAVLTTAQAAGK